MNVFLPLLLASPVSASDPAADMVSRFEVGGTEVLLLLRNDGRRPRGVATGPWLDFEVLDEAGQLPRLREAAWEGSHATAILKPGEERAIAHANVAEWARLKGGASYREACSYETYTIRDHRAAETGYGIEPVGHTFTGEVQVTAPQVPDDCVVVASAYGRTREAHVCAGSPAGVGAQTHRIFDGQSDSTPQVLEVNLQGANRASVTAVHVSGGATCVQLERAWDHASRPFPEVTRSGSVCLMGQGAPGVELPFEIGLIDRGGEAQSCLADGTAVTFFDARPTQTDVSICTRALDTASWAPFPQDTRPIVPLGVTRQ